MTRLLFIPLFFLTAPVSAADPWSDKDKATEVAYLLLHAADWGQTRYIAEHPENHREGNVFLGEHPSRKRVNAYFLTTALLHVGAVHVLPSRWRPAFQYFWIGVEAGVVTNNYRAGVRMDF